MVGYTCTPFRSEGGIAGTRCRCPNFQFLVFVCSRGSVVFQIQCISTMVSEALFGYFHVRSYVVIGSVINKTQTQEKDTFSRYPKS